MMSETEQHRRQLLHQVKGSGQFSGRNIPAIHPRYTSAYHSIYESGNITEKGTFQLRCIVAILCFVAFVWMKQEDVQVASVNSSRIVNQIEKQVDVNTVQKVWEEL